MRILIVENEIYLAGSIASKLAELGHDCEIAKNTKEALRDDKFDVVLLSTTLGGEDFYPVIEKFKHSIIILLISYISSDTVLKPIQAGASDYIQKPFMIEELVRKINHFSRYNRLEMMAKFYETLMEQSLKSSKIAQIEYRKIKFPLLVKSPKTSLSDRFVLNFAAQANASFRIITATDENEIITECERAKAEFIYIQNLSLFSSNTRENILKACIKKRAIIATNDMFQDAPFDAITINSDEQGFSIEEIVTIDEYIKHVITTYQDRYPDTELAKKLGISRKSLWEKRKKYDIIKKK